MTIDIMRLVQNAMEASKYKDFAFEEAKKTAVSYLIQFGRPFDF
jgi:hypothetical protein